MPTVPTWPVGKAYISSDTNPGEQSTETHVRSLIKRVRITNSDR